MPSPRVSATQREAIAEASRTVRDFKVGDHVETRMQGMTGVVEKVGRKWVTVRWTQPHGATWTKQHLPEWLTHA